MRHVITLACSLSLGCTTLGTTPTTEPEYERVEFEVGEAPVSIQLASGPMWLDTLTPNCGPHHEDPQVVFDRLEQQDPSWSHSSAHAQLSFHDEVYVELSWWNERPTRMDIAISNKQICLSSLVEPELGLDGLATNCICTAPTLWSRDILRYSMFDDAEAFRGEPPTYRSIH